MSCKRIAYSLCGEGFGHYGRSIGIIKNLSAKFPDYFIDVYCYDYTFDMMSLDKNLPANVTVNRIPGLRFRHNKKSEVNFFRTILFSRRNWSNAAQMAWVEVIRWVIHPVVRFFNRKTQLAFNWTKRWAREFDLAVVDWEPLLPRIAKLRKKPYISVDSIHLLQYANYRKEGFSLRDWYYLFVNRFVIKLYSPLSSLSLITTLYNFKIRKKYLPMIHEVGPLVRKEIADLKDQVVYEDFILVYIRKVVRKSILPVIKQCTGEKFVIFTEQLTDEERTLYQAPHMEFHDVDPLFFLDYLRRCKAVISTSGYTLITEAIILKKPFFAVVLGGILGFEQKLSLISLQKSGCGDGCSIRDFNVSHLEAFAAHMGVYHEVLHTKDFKDETEKVSDIIGAVVRGEDPRF